MAADGTGLAGADLRREGPSRRLRGMGALAGGHDTDDENDDAKLKLYLGIMFVLKHFFVKIAPSVKLEYGSVFADQKVIWMFSHSS